MATISCSVTLKWSFIEFIEFIENNTLKVPILRLINLDCMYAQWLVNMRKMETFNGVY